MTPFVRVAQLAEELAAISSRIAKRAAIAQTIAEIHAAAPGTDDAGLFALYLAGTPFAEANPSKLNAGGVLLSRALLAVSGATDTALTAAYRRHGDLGAAAFDLFTERHHQPAPPSLTLAHVSEAFAAMAAARTTSARAARVEALLRHATPLEAKYLLKLMLGDMRIGVKQSLVEEAIAAAASTPESPITPAQVRHAVMLEADLAAAVRRAFAGTLAEARMRLFHPLGFMLASPVDSPEEAVARFTSDKQPAVDQPATDNPPATIHAFLEDKYDGIRAQLHCGDPNHPGRVALYSRNREDITESFPELAEAFAAVPANDSTHSFILDGEILAWNFGTPQMRVPHLSDSLSVANVGIQPTNPAESSAPHALPFSILGQRIGRKRVTNEIRAQIPVIFMAFDLLCANGELILDLPLRERRNRLETIADRLIPCTVSPSNWIPTPTPPNPASFN